MRWSAGDRSNIDDYRGRSGIGGIPIGIGGFVVLLLLSWATGTDFLSLFTNGGARSGPGSGSVAIELQADCFAGIWGHAASQGGRFAAGHVELEPGDADEALRAAGAIGDDRLQRMATGRVQPERFTHGTSQQRV